MIIVIGVSGSGKTAVGTALARRLGFAFEEGDDHHPPANLAKMGRGEPLDDDDRRPWLLALAGKVEGWLAEGRDVVLSCSALRRSYRDLLRGGADGARLVYLRGEAALIRRRLEARRGHFMPPGLLDSQLAALEEPTDAITVDIDDSPEAIAETVAARLGR